MKRRSSKAKGSGVVGLIVSKLHSWRIFVAFCIIFGVLVATVIYLSNVNGKAQRKLL